MSKLTFDKVHLRIFKNCNLDKLPDLKIFFDNELIKYPKLTTYITDGQEPKLDLLKEGTVVDEIKIGRYNLESMRALLKELGIERDEAITPEMLAAQRELEKHFYAPPEKVEF